MINSALRHPPREMLRAYAEGKAELTRRLLVEAHLALCPTCPYLVGEYHDTELRLPAATIADEIYLPPFDRVWAAAEHAARKRRTPEAAVLPRSVLDALPDPAGWRWITAWPQRVQLALLLRDPDTGSELYLSYYAPQSRFPRHSHVGLEENVILAGGFQNGDQHVETGDWVIGEPGTEHAPTTDADEDCWCLSRIERPGLRFSGWRGCLQRLLGRNK
jgi:putative transcriptional regulator